MCGFSVTQDPITNQLRHRGVTSRKIEYAGWKTIFNSLPLSSHNTGIELPLELGNCLLLFNGEIFNYKDLDPTAKSDVHYLRNALGGSDVLSFYQASKYWDGFWSIVLVMDTGRVYAFTDPLGKKQLYHNQLGFSSEIKPILRNYNYLPYTDSKFFTNQTNFSSVERLLPGILYSQDSPDRPIRVFWQQNYFRAPEEQNIVSLIRKSVQDRMENRYDGISILLSGGLDSNIILYHLLEITDDIEVISMDNNEKETIEKICDYYGITPNWVSDQFTEEDLREAVFAYEHSLDYGSLIPNYLLFRACSNSLVFTGDGADEFFGGYTRAKKTDTWEYDVLGEIPYYHNIRIDRTSMAHTKEARSPLMSYPLMSYSKTLPWDQRSGKKILRNAYEGKIPKFIREGEKIPLRHSGNKEKNRILIKQKHEQLFNYENF